ncbi:MAG: MFS transporter [Nocardioidaceae bacterium]|nr:MFS transporter [Nocardioidaceae bacterium]
MATSERPSIASFWHDLPREGKLLLSVVAFEFIGTGLVLPFWVVYFHELRGFSLDVVGILLAVMSAAGAIASVPGGMLIDRAGARAAMLVVLCSSMLGNIVVAFADNLALAVLGVAIVGTGFGLGWPASQALIASVVPSEIRSRYYGMNFSLLNLGIGIGGIVGGLVVDVGRVSTFQAMYLADAVSYLPSMFLLLVPLRHIGRPAKAPEHEDGGEISYLAVLRTPAMATMTVLGFAAAFVGYAQLNAGMPAYARAIGEVSTQGLGIAFAINTLVIVLLQLVVLQRIEGRRRTRVIVAMSVIWAVSWGLLSASGIAPGTVTATFFVAACAGVFALGETLLQPTVPAIVNDLAPDHLRGRFNALSAGTFQLASILGPIVAGFLIGHGLHLEYVLLLVAGCGLVAWLSVARLEPQLDARTNGLQAPPREVEAVSPPARDVAAPGVPVAETP